MNECKENLGIKFRIFTGKNELVHFHMEIEILYVLSGKIEVFLADEKYTLHKGKIILINTNKKHRYVAEVDALICQISIDYFMLVKVMKRDFIVFWCNSVINEDKDYNMLCNILNKIIGEYAVNREENFMMKSLQFQFLHCLTQNFLVQSESALVDQDDKKMERILQYINNYYIRGINLSEMAQQFFMSDSSFSRYFKKKMGINFVEYVNNVRLHYALEDILYTDKSITNIALNCGFSNSSAFNKVFKETYHMAPTSYKKLMRNRILNEKDMKVEKCEKQLNQYLEILNAQEILLATVKTKINIDSKAPGEFLKVNPVCINAGMASDLLMGKLREQILEIRTVLNIKYVRICNIFHADLHIYKKDNMEMYNFDKVDSVLDFIVENDMYPMIDLAPKPKRASLGVGKDLILEKSDTVKNFENIEEWTVLLTSFMEHLMRRYEEEIISKWLMELWYDEQHLIMQEETSEESYLEYWKSTWKIVKGICPTIKIGGNGLGAGYNRKKLQEHLEFWKTSIYQPDFLSTYIYPYSKQGPEKEIYAKRMTDFDFVSKMTDDYRRFMKELNYTEPYLYVTEWSTSISERNFYNDCAAKAAHIAYQFIQNIGKTEMMVYWHISDLLSQYYDAKEPLVGANGLLTKDGIPKPIFFAYLFMQKMGKNVIKRGEQYLVTTNGKNRYEILLCNPKRFNHNYYLKAEDEIKVNDLEDIFEDHQQLTLQFTLDNMENRTYHLKTYKLNEQYGSVLNEWKNFGYINELNKEDVIYLKTVCQPHINLQENTVLDGQMTFTVTLEAHEVQLISIYY